MKYMMIAAFLTVLPLMAHAQSKPPQGWWNANRDSAKISPLPDKEPQAVVEVFAARAYGWRKYFGVHTWVSTKEKNAKHYMVYQVMGWRKWRNLSVVSAEKDLPDRYWYNNKPELIFEIKGEQAEKMIPQIKAASESYAYPNDYVLWPGPNSNSYVSHIMRHTDGFTVELPPHAIGKNWIDDGKFFARSETKTGYQFSFFGLLGLTVGKAEGLEINILGLTFGFDVMRPALKLPFIGRVGMTDKGV